MPAAAKSSHVGTKSGGPAGTPPAVWFPNPMGTSMVHGLIVIFFAIAVGLTASGITSNVYKLVAKKPETMGGKIVYAGVMVLAGPNVLLENAATSFRAKKCSRIAFWLAALVAGYWSFVLGLFVLNLYIAG